MFDMTCSPGRRVGRYALSALMGIGASFAAVLLVMSQYPAVPAVMLLAALFGAKWDRMSAIVIMAFACAGAYLLGGGLYALVTFVSGAVPGIWMLEAIRRRTAQPSMAAAGVFAAVVGTGAALVICKAGFGKDVVGMLAESLNALYEELARMMLEQMEMLGEVFGAYLGQAVDTEAEIELLKTSLGDLEALYGNVLPGMLVSGCVLGGLVSAFTARRALAKKGIDLPESVTIVEWRLPYRLATLLVLAMLVLRLASGVSPYAPQLFYTVYYLAFALFLLRAAGSMLARFAVSSGGRRALMIVLTVLLVMGGAIGTAAVLFGGAIAIFGRDGDVYRFIMKRRQKNGGDGGSAQ